MSDVQRTSRICNVERISMKLRAEPGRRSSQAGRLLYIISCLQMVTGREGCTKTPRSFERPNDHIRHIQGLPVMKRR
ncbi:hypothetical protein FIBSPDRAFT_879110 [Athelia psychrophila]|uniref:Uncharacterized protein n=1 Tax=Athelia psychrophila TaxID=1759441 RepID=A0A167UCW0_9AGAM|nr:hypothetical protein FIBSPDRAFT_879110 [Fibularhizoctonia sp. CBS 109695]